MFCLKVAVTSEVVVTNSQIYATESKCEYLIIIIWAILPSQLSYMFYKETVHTKWLSFFWMCFGIPVSWTRHRKLLHGDARSKSKYVYSTMAVWWGLVKIRMMTLLSHLTPLQLWLQKKLAKNARIKSRNKTLRICITGYFTTETTPYASQTHHQYIMIAAYLIFMQFVLYSQFQYYNVIV